MLLDVAAMVFFAALSIPAIFLDRPDLDGLERYAQVLSSDAIAVVALGSPGFTPFTEQYARLSTQREVWGLPPRSGDTSSSTLSSGTSRCTSTRVRTG